MIDPNCAVQVGTHTSPYWTTTEHPDWKVCDRHARQYDERPDLGPHTWVLAE